MGDRCCAHIDCSTVSHAHGLCNTHYRQLLRRGARRVAYTEFVARIILQEAA